jgi:hypothetical protein
MKIISVKLNKFLIRNKNRYNLSKILIRNVLYINQKLKKNIKLKIIVKHKKNNLIKKN